MSRFLFFISYVTMDESKKDTVVSIVSLNVWLIVTGI